MKVYLQYVSEIVWTLPRIYLKVKAQQKPH